VLARDLQRLSKVGADVVDVLDADADADHVLAAGACTRPFVSSTWATSNTKYILIIP
jgi:hypothetical protein